MRKGYYYFLSSQSGFCTFCIFPSSYKNYTPSKNMRSFNLYNCEGNYLHINVYYFRELPSIVLARKINSTSRVFACFIRTSRGLLLQNNKSRSPRMLSANCTFEFIICALTVWNEIVPIVSARSLIRRNIA